MVNTDKAKFKELFDALAEMYGKDKPSVLQLQMMFAALEPYDFDQISIAASKHIAKSKFFPRPADLIEILEGVDVTVEEIIAAAKLAKTPMGVMARIHIGTWDLDRQDAFYLKLRAEEVLQLMPEWKRRAQDGRYTDHEISMMIKHGVEPSAPFAFGLAKPKCADAIESRAKLISQTDRHQYLLEPPIDHTDKPSNEFCPKVMAVVSEILSDEEEKNKNSIWGDLDAVKRELDDRRKSGHQTRRKIEQETQGE
jgi:hypothetical protein